jgi:hypothetical protein
MAPQNSGVGVDKTILAPAVADLSAPIRSDLSSTPYCHKKPPLLV